VRTFVVIFAATLAIGATSCKKKLTATGPDGEAIVAQSEHARKVEVTVQAKVARMLADDTEGLPHERFLLKLSNGTSVLVAHDTQYAKRVPLEAGDTVRIHGEYIWNEDGGVIHWTHHSDSPRHEGGWIEFKGEKYQ
jgi:hypothetical protein